jgi:hypothetical protein
VADEEAASITGLKEQIIATVEGMKAYVDIVETAL